jgi:ubiquinone/menaquinone biosynthesis C-methylase UbiE
MSDPHPGYRIDDRTRVPGEPTAMRVFDIASTTHRWDEIYYSDRAALDFYDRAIAETVRLLEAAPGETILDAGCGAGVHAIRIAQAGRRAHAIDISAAALDDARQRAILNGVGDRITFDQQDLRRLTIADGDYRRIVSWGVIIHIPQVEGALDELGRVLAYGGRLALYVTNMHSAEEMLRSLLGPLIGKPQKSDERRTIGRGRWCRFNGEDLWLWRFDIPALARHLEARSLRLVARRAGELTEHGETAPVWLRRLKSQANALWFRCRLSARLAHANLLVFEKTREADDRRRGCAKPSGG